MAKSTAGELFALIEKSRLLTSEQMAQARQAAEGKNDDTSAICAALVRRSLLTRWQAGQLLSGRWSFFLGKYRLIDLLGRGGMGSVFLGEHVTMNRRVALKVLSKQVGKEPGSLDRFLAEARLIAALDHPNIVHAFSVDCEGDRYYIVMEYVDGSDLQRVVEKEGPMDCSRAVDCIRQAAEGLAHAHRSHVVHCDIKPSNLLLTDQGTIKVLDMGVARLVGPGSDAGKPDESVLGSVDYLAPEQALASPSFDHRADIYSLGCTFYFLLTGRAPFPEGSLAQRIMNHQTQSPREIAELRADVPKELVDICGRMMMKDPDERYQSAEEVSGELAAWRGAAAAKPKAKPAAAPPKRAVAAEEAAIDSREDIFDLADSPKTPAMRVPSVRKPGAQAAKMAGSAAAAESKAATASEDAAVATVPIKKKPAGLFSTPRGKWIVVGGVAAGVLLLAVGITVAVMMSGAGKKEVASVAQATTKPAATDTAKPAADPEGGKPKDGKPKGGKLAVDQNFFSDKPTDTPAEEVKPTGEKPSTPDGATEETTPADPAKPDPAKPDPAKPDPSQPDLTGGDLPKVDPPAEPPKQEPPKEEPPKQDPAPVQPTPQEPPKEEPKPAQPAKVDPFQGLAKDVELPKVPRDAAGDEPIGEAAAMGTVHLEPNSPLTIELVGGATAINAAKQFDIEPSAGGDNPTWLLHYESKGAPEGKSPDRIDIGRITLAGDQLQFQWLGGAGKGKGTYLHNCGLKLSASGASKWLPLSRPVHAEPLVLDLDRGNKKLQLPLEAVADPALLRVQITGVDGELPKFEYKPSDTVQIQAKGEKEKPMAGIAFQPEKGLPVAIVLSLDVRGNNANLTMGVMVEAGEKTYIPLTTAGMRSAGMKLQSDLARCETMLKTPGLQDAAKKNIESQKKAGTELGEKMQVVETLRQAIHKKVKLKYRVYLMCGEEKIELASTEIAAPAAPEPVKKGPAGRKKGGDTKTPEPENMFDS